MRIRQTLIVAALMLSVVGCDTSTVADDLGQREANQIVAILRDHGIEGVTEKGRGSRAGYTVKVSSSQFGEAASLLSKLGLPAERRASFAELVAPSGLLPASQDVEDLRLDRAMASEVEDLLEGYSGVSSASVVVRSHSISSGDRASVSVVIQKKQGATISEPNLRQMVERAVPGMRGENILLAIADAPTTGGARGAPKGAADLVPFLMFWRVPESEYVGLAMLLGGLLLFVSMLAGVGGYIYGQFSVARAVDGAGASSGENGGRERRDDDEISSDGGV